MNKMQLLVKTYTIEGLASTQFITLLGTIITWNHTNQNSIQVWDHGDEYQTTKEIEEVLKDYGFSYSLPINYKELRIYNKEGN